VLEYQTKDTKEVQATLVTSGGVAVAVAVLAVLERTHRQMGIHKMVMVD
jgi:hypothetical protein